MPGYSLCEKTMIPTKKVTYKVTPLSGGPLNGHSDGYTLVKELKYGSLNENQWLTLVSEDFNESVRNVITDTAALKKLSEAYGDRNVYLIPSVCCSFIVAAENNSFTVAEIIEIAASIRDEISESEKQSCIIADCYLYSSASRSIRTI